jgi:hypothetical protein
LHSLFDFVDVCTCWNVYIRDTVICMSGSPVTLLDVFVHSSNLSAFSTPDLWWNP